MLTRAVEDRMVAMYRGGDLLGSLYSGHWHEAISVGAASTLRPDDYMAPIHRDLGAHLWRGMEPWQVMASFMGKATSPTGGRDGTLHYGRLDLNIYNLPSHIPANFPVATGMAFAAKYRGEDRVCLAFCGDGSTSRADFHEALTIASVLELPNIFVIENNQYAYSTPLRMHVELGDVLGQGRRVRDPGRHGGRHRRAGRARRGRRGGRAGPGGRRARRSSRASRCACTATPSTTRPTTCRKEMYEECAKKDPVELFEKVLLEAGRDRRRHGQAGARGRPPGRHRRAAQGARRSDAGSQQHRGRCLCRLTNEPAPTYLEAVGLALDAEMERDPDVFLIGEDVGQFGGAFKVTKGFLDKYGPRRVVDTPIAETGFTGLAAGAALVGLRPVVEFQFADFISCAFDPIINVLARHHWRTGDAMPVTMRAPFGGRLRAGPHALQSVESYFAHVPGPQDRHAGHARGRRRAADHRRSGTTTRRCTWRTSTSTGGCGPPGRCRWTRSRSGSPRSCARARDVTLITYSAGVSQGLEIAEELDKEGISVEVVDVRTLVPLDVETIVNSVRKTSRAVVLHEAAKRMGYGAEIAATIQEECFWHLDQPVVRIAAKNTPTPDQPAAGGRGDPAARGDRRDAPEGGEGLAMPATTLRGGDHDDSTWWCWAADRAGTRRRCTPRPPG